MALKVKSRFSSHNMLFRLSNALRTIGWFAAMITLGASIPNFVTKYHDFSTSQWYADSALQHTINATVAVWIAGLGFAACAFILSLLLYTGLMMVANKRTQLELLQRLSRERSKKMSPLNAIILIETL